MSPWQGGAKTSLGMGKRAHGSVPAAAMRGLTKGLSSHQDSGCFTIPFPPTPLIFPQLVTLRGSILEDATPTATKHGTVRGLPLKDALEYVIPELNIHCLRLAISTPKVTEQLLKLDEQGVSSDGDRIGVLSAP